MRRDGGLLQLEANYAATLARTTKRCALQMCDEVPPLKWADPAKGPAWGAIRNTTEDTASFSTNRVSTSAAYSS
jgi:hypothetical protein